MSDKGINEEQPEELPATGSEVPPIYLLYAQVVRGALD